MGFIDTVKDCIGFLFNSFGYVIAEERSSVRGEFISYTKGSLTFRFVSDKYENSFRFDIIYHEQHLCENSLLEEFLKVPSSLADTSEKWIENVFRYLEEFKEDLLEADSEFYPQLSAFAHAKTIEYNQRSSKTSI